MGADVRDSEKFMSQSCIFAPEILLPVPSVDMTAWAVIACDQHTSDQSYWEKLEKLVGDKPSTLRLTLPEIYLNGDYSSRISEICETMRTYKGKGIFRKLPKGFILTERSTPYVPMRRGIVLAIDLEAYSYEKKSDALIRASEQTILERIPPRVKIREGAPLEFPHIMLLYDDPDDIVMRSFADEDLPVLYDFDLNMGGGHIRGKFIKNFSKVINLFDSLICNGLLFMVGDGNHSLATAKVIWDRKKETLSPEERLHHPARFALCEAVNLHDDGIYFEAIHRVVKGINTEKFLSGCKPFGKGKGSLYVGGKRTDYGVAVDVPAAVAGVDAYISKYIAENGGEVDYIHGESAVQELTKVNSDCVGICLPKMKKSELFPQVNQYGSLPRKTFSMGESEEKRYYIEGKEI